MKIPFFFSWKYLLNKMRCFLPPIQERCGYLYAYPTCVDLVHFYYCVPNPWIYSVSYLLMIRILDSSNILFDIDTGISLHRNISRCLQSVCEDTPLIRGYIARGVASSVDQRTPAAGCLIAYRFNGQRCHSGNSEIPCCHETPTTTPFSWPRCQSV